MENISINHYAVIVAALSDFVVGAIWYSPILFYKAWMNENNFREETLKEGNPGVTYTLTFVLALVISYALAFFLNGAKSDVIWGLTLGIISGFCWAAMAFTIIALFEKRSFRYILINCGYIIISFAIKGLIIGTWR